MHWPRISQLLRPGRTVKKLYRTRKWTLLQAEQNKCVYLRREGNANENMQRSTAVHGQYFKREQRTSQRKLLPRLSAISLQYEP